MRRGIRLPSIRGMIVSMFGVFFLIALLPFFWVILGPFIVFFAIGLGIGFTLGKLWRHFLRG